MPGVVAVTEDDAPADTRGVTADVAGDAVVVIASDVDGASR
jgi:hypothetical protein